MKQFDLTEALVDEILFSMEDQDGEFFIDTQEGIVVGGIDFDDSVLLNDQEDERYIDLPGWDSSNGFRLMEHFAAAFHNPLVREQLTSALNRGKGVFRAFKNILNQYPEAEKYWFVFKDQEMKKEIFRWYNGLREEWGLEKIGTEPEETGDLVLEDFRFRNYKPADASAVEKLHDFCLKEAGEAGAPPGQINNPVLDSPGGLALIVESGGGEFAGYIYAVKDGTNLHVNNLEVKLEYRGLGIGESLLAHLLGELKPAETKRVYFDLPSSSMDFSRVLVREGFEPYLMRYSLDVKKNKI
jgi:ribosomal protein S18 acetylase RimI-like enzyme